MVKFQPSKLAMRVRFPLPAYSKDLIYPIERPGGFAFAPRLGCLLQSGCGSRLHAPPLRWIRQKQTKKIICRACRSLEQSRCVSTKLVKELLGAGITMKKRRLPPANERPEKDCPFFCDLILFEAFRAKHLRHHLKMWLEYLMGHMRNYRISRLRCTLLLLLLSVFSIGPIFAGGEELSTNGNETESVTNNETTTQNVGVGFFQSLPFHVSASIRGGYDDNVAAVPFDRQGSLFMNLNVALTYNFGSPRTTISLQTNGGITDYFDHSAGINFDFNPNVSFSLVHKATPRLTLSMTTFMTYQNQPDFADNGGTTRRSGSFFYGTSKFSAAYRWKPRFTTITSFTFGATWYDDPGTAAFENRFEYTFGNEFRFLLWPTTTLVGEYRFGLFAYETNSSRDSFSHYLLAGLDHNFSPRFSVTTRAGVEFRTYTNLDDERTDPYFEGTLTYALGPHLTLSWTNRYGIEEPDVIGSIARTTFRTGLTGSYKLTARTLATVTAYYQHDNNDSSTRIIPGFPFPLVQPGFVEDSLSISLALHYAINHTWAAELGYDYSEIQSDQSFREYYRNRFYGGVNFTF
jgi:hypothetical protein